MLLRWSGPCSPGGAGTADRRCVPLGRSDRRVLDTRCAIRAMPGDGDDRHRIARGSGPGRAVVKRFRTGGVQAARGSALSGRRSFRQAPSRSSHPSREGPNRRGAPSTKRARLFRHRGTRSADGVAERRRPPAVRDLRVPRRPGRGASAAARGGRRRDRRADRRDAAQPGRRRARSAALVPAAGPPAALRGGAARVAGARDRRRARGTPSARPRLRPHPGGHDRAPRSARSRRPTHRRACGGPGPSGELHAARRGRADRPVDTALREPVGVAWLAPRPPDPVPRAPVCRPCRPPAATRPC